MVRCPWHGWEFDIRTGQSWCEPAKVRARAYPTEIAAGAEVVKGPCVAETVLVTVAANDVSHAQMASGALTTPMTRRSLDTVDTDQARPGNGVKRMRNRQSSWSETLHQMTSTCCGGR